MTLENASFIMKCASEVSASDEEQCANEYSRARTSPVSKKPEASTFKYLPIEPAQHLFFFLFFHNLQGQFYSGRCTGLISRSADFVHDLRAVAF
jgi:hypothetical protein